MRIYSSFFLILFLCQSVSAQNLKKQTLDSVFQSLEQHDKFMGSVTIMREGDIIYTHSSGFADVDNQIKNSQNTKYRIGSISKTFTAVLVMKAVEQHKLQLNEKLADYYPEIENAGKISIRQLLQHRSGIHNFTDDKDYLNYNTKQKSEKEMLEIMAKKGSDFQPGHKFQYSNSNYLLLSYILEDVFKKNYKTLLNQYITEPLNLKNTYFGGNINVTENESKSYLKVNTWELQPETNTSIPLGAGGIVSNPSDLVKFARALFTEDLVKPESLEQMKTLKDSYGLGLFNMPFYDKKGFGHTGGIDGFASAFAYFPSSKTTYAICSNGSDYSLNKISIALLNAAFGKEVKIPDFSTYDVDAAQLEKYTGKYTTDKISMDLKIFTENGKLMGQGSGQPAFPLTPKAKHKFVYDKAGVKIEFHPAKNQLILEQGGGEIVFSKD